MEQKYPHLFSPKWIRGSLFRNRLMASPIGAWNFSPDNYIFDYAIDHFREVAAGGAASITVGHTEVNYGEEDTDRFGLYFDLRRREGTGALSEFAHTIRRHGAHVSLQLNYGGLPTGGSKAAGQVCYAPVGCVREDGLVVHEITKEKLDEIVRQYVQCARKLKTCGFDMVMIHGAHGWLPAQFAAPENTRRDEYGGSLENRLRFPVELARAIREAVGDRMIIEYRISGHEPELEPELFEEEVALVKALEPYIDLIHVSSGGGGGEAGFLHTFPTYLDPYCGNAAAAGALKARVDVPVVVVGSIATPEMAEEILARGQADFIAMGRELLADPELPRKAQCGKSDEIRPCIGCYHCLDHLHSTHLLDCAVNPRTGHEHGEEKTVPARQRKKVVVAGGGPGGMQAAITAAERGHEVVLMEQSGALGGLLKVCDGNPVKERLFRLKEYLIRETAAAGVRVLLHTQATRERVEAEHPDAVIVASGSLPAIPPIPGVDLPQVMDCIAVHRHPERLGGRIVLIGGNLVGCETALCLRRTGERQVTILEMTDRLHADADGILGFNLETHLQLSGVQALRGCRCTAIDGDGVHYEARDGVRGCLEADTVVLAVGMKAQQTVFTALLGSAPQVIPVGDCITPATVRQAISSAYYAARDL